MSWIYYVSVMFAALHNSVHLVSRQHSMQCSMLMFDFSPENACVQFHNIILVCCSSRTPNCWSHSYPADVQEGFRQLGLLDHLAGRQRGCGGELWLVESWSRDHSPPLWLEVGGEVECGLVCLEASSCSALRYDRDTGTCFTAQLVSTHSQISIRNADL